MDAAARASGADRIKGLKLADFDEPQSLQARRLPGAKGEPSGTGERQRKTRSKPLGAAELEALLQRMLLVGHGAAPDHDEGGGAAAAAAAAATATATTAAGGEAAAPSAVEYFKASQKQGGSGAAVAAAVEDAAAGALLRPKTPKELGRGCDYILAAVLLRAPPALAAQWARPFGWHGLGERAFRSLGEEKAPPKPVAKMKPGHRGEFAAPKGRIVAELNGAPRPQPLTPALSLTNLNPFP